MVRARHQLELYRERFLRSGLKGFVKDSTWAFAASGTTLGLYSVEIMLLSRYFSKTTLGIYFLVLSIPELVQQVLDVRADEIMVRYLPVFAGDGQRRRALA